ncbi:hypothetical protein MBLNU13_g09252t1 [Cladosporium sp. NU13]
MAIGYEYVSHIGHSYTFPDSNASFWNTFITDPPCHEANILSFTLNLDYPTPPAQQPNHDPTLTIVNFLDTNGLTIGSDAGLRMGDVLQVCLRLVAMLWACMPVLGIGNVRKLRSAKLSKR